MKLYTEQQVMEMLRIAKNTYETIDNIINGFSEIELPTDEEIEGVAKVKIDLSSDCFGQYDFTSGKQDGFIDGAIWMRDKIKGGEQ